MKSTFSAFLALATVGVLAVGASNSAQGEPKDKTIRGTWALAVSGFTDGTGTDSTGALVPAGVPLYAIATVTFDGKGGCSSKDQIVLGGTYIPSRFGFRSTDPGGSCTYQVNADGTGYFDVEFPGAGTTTVTFVLSDKESLRFIAQNSTLGIFGGGEMKRQDGRGVKD
jgi:hypothetical protein